MSRFRLRRSEWTLVVYFVYVTVLAYILPVKPSAQAAIFWLNLAIIGVYLLVAYADSLRRGRLLSTIRDWYPTALLLLAYREMGWLAPSEHSYALERAWVVWDKFFLNGLGVKALIESAGPLFPAVLELCYTLVYSMPFIGLGALYVFGRRDHSERLLFPLVLSVLTAYVLYPYFPSEPPRTVFPGEDFPSYMTVFRRFNWAMLGSQGIHTSVFPSSHVSASFTVALMLRSLLPERKRLRGFLLTLAILIATATVYGRYHYLADVAAGLTIALVVCAPVWYPGLKRRSILLFGGTAHERASGSPAGRHSGVISPTAVPHGGDRNHPGDLGKGDPGEGSGRDGCVQGERPDRGVQGQRTG